MLSLLFGLGVNVFAVKAENLVLCTKIKITVFLIFWTQNLSAGPNQKSASISIAKSIFTSVLNVTEKFIEK